jgi:hypothetical protein
MPINRMCLNRIFFGLARENCNLAGSSISMQGFWLGIAALLCVMVIATPLDDYARNQLMPFACET